MVMKATLLLAIVVKILVHLGEDRRNYRKRLGPHPVRHSAQLRFNCGPEVTNRRGAFLICGVDIAELAQPTMTR